MAVNKVEYAGRTLVDMTDATATAETILEGYTAYGADGQQIVGIAKTTKMIQQTILLPSSCWVGNQQTVGVSGVTEDCVIFVAADLVEDNVAEYMDCGVWCSGQGAGTLTFDCSYIPWINLAVNVAILT